MPSRPIVLVHGYSDRGRSFERWKSELVQRGYAPDDVKICTYESLVNEITIKDIAEGFDQILRQQGGIGADEPFDAMVHSTGMLVIRAWLTTYGDRRDRLKHLVGLAPATFGSPLAHKGRSWLGSIFKGNKELGPDFLEAGDLVLDGLELGSRYTWDLAHKDMVGTTPFYGPTRKTPFPFIFCGNAQYTGLRRLIGEDGTDGTVRWAGCALNTRKIVLDLTHDTSDDSRSAVAPWSNVDVPVTLVEGLNHATILSDPTPALLEMAWAALQVNSETTFNDWLAMAARRAKPAQDRVDPYQQFVIRAVDERGDPIPDYNLQLLTVDGGKVKEFDTDVHTYSTDPSLRCFHVNLGKLDLSPRKKLQVRVIASSGTYLVGYSGVGSEKMRLEGVSTDQGGKWDAVFDLDQIIGDDKIKLFYPFTTTLIELQLNREPLVVRSPLVRWGGS